MRASLKLFLTSILAVGIAGGAAAASPGPARGGFGHGDFAARRAARIAKFDANKNGVLDPGERAVMKRQLAAKRFAKLDKDRNGVLSLDEFAAARHHKRGLHKRGKRGKAGWRRGGSRMPNRP